MNSRGILLSGTDDAEVGTVDIGHGGKKSKKQYLTDPGNGTKWIATHGDLQPAPTYYCTEVLRALIDRALALQHTACDVDAQSPSTDCPDPSDCTSGPIFTVT